MASLLSASRLCGGDLKDISIHSLDMAPLSSLNSDRSLIRPDLDLLAGFVSTIILVLVLIGCACCKRKKSTATMIKSNKKSAELFEQTNGKKSLKVQLKTKRGRVSHVSTPTTGCPAKVDVRKSATNKRLIRKIGKKSAKTSIASSSGLNPPPQMGPDPSTRQISSTDPTTVVKTARYIVMDVDSDQSLNLLKTVATASRADYGTPVDQTVYENKGHLYPIATVRPDNDRSKSGLMLSATPSLVAKSKSAFMLSDKNDDIAERETLPILDIKKSLSAGGIRNESPYISLYPNQTIKNDSPYISMPPPSMEEVTAVSMTNIRKPNVARSMTVSKANKKIGKLKARLIKPRAGGMGRSKTMIATQKCILKKTTGMERSRLL